METFNVGKIEEFEDKSKKVVTIGDEEVGVFRLGDEFFAWRNICPHQGGPICQGRIFSLVLENIDDKMESHGRIYDNNKVNIVCMAWNLILELESILGTQALHWIRCLFKLMAIRFIYCLRERIKNGR